MKSSQVSTANTGDARKTKRATPENSKYNMKSIVLINSVMAGTENKNKYNLVVLRRNLKPESENDHFGSATTLHTDTVVHHSAGRN